MSIELFQGDCREVMKTLADHSVDAVVTDPPYEIGFMGRKWDATGVAFDLTTWTEALRVLKPGGYLLAFSGTRTYHRMVCAIEDAGFEIRDQIGWAFGSGFPKSHNGPWGGTALKPAWEPIVVARKPLIGTVEANWREHGTGALNIDACRVGYGDLSLEEVHKQAGSPGGSTGIPKNAYGSFAGVGGEAIQFHTEGRWPANLIHDGSDEVLEAFPQAPGQIAKASTSDTQRGGQNTYGAMVRGSNGQDPSRDASSSAARFFYCAKADRADRNEGLDDPGPQFKQNRTPRDAEKVNAAKRGNHHPTVKPTDLMRYLCRLVTPAGGMVLDPFMGSGSTLKAAELEGFRGIGIELNPEYIEIARRRIAADAPLFAA